MGLHLSSFYDSLNSSPGILIESDFSLSYSSPDVPTQGERFITRPPFSKPKPWIVEYSEPMGAIRGVGEGIPEHMKDMYDRASAGVGEDEAVALKLLLIKYRGVFAEHDMDLGDFSAVKHVIDTRDARPVKQRPRRTPLAFEGE